MGDFLKKARSWKHKDIAVFDVAATAVLAAVLAPPHRSLCAPIYTTIVFILLIVIAIVVHVARDVPTRLGAYLGINTVAEVHAKR
jgi:hypothetical protein